LRLVNIYYKFIPQLDTFTALLHILMTLSGLEFSNYIEDSKNYKVISEVLNKITVIIIANTYLVLPDKDVYELILCTDALDCGIRATLLYV
jgi:hypothetical protein